MRQAVADRERLDDVVKLLELPWVGLLRPHRRQDGRRSEVVREQRSGHPEKRQEDGARDRAARPVCELADDQSRDHPDGEEPDDHDDAVALVARDLVVHVLARLAVGFLDRVPQALGRVAAPDLRPHEAIAESGHVL